MNLRARKREKGSGTQIAERKKTFCNLKLLLLTTITLASLLNRVPTARDFFTGNWEADNQKVTLIRNYMRQPEKPFGDFDCHCPQFAHIGKVVPTPERSRSVIERALQIHNSHTNVCVLQYYNEQDEYFADICSAWTMVQVKMDPMTIQTALYKLVPNGKGGQNHPSHKKRIQALKVVVDQWNSTFNWPAGS